VLDERPEEERSNEAPESTPLEACLQSRFSAVSSEAEEGRSLASGPVELSTRFHDVLRTVALDDQQRIVGLYDHNVRDSDDRDHAPRRRGQATLGNCMALGGSRTRMRKSTWGIAGVTPVRRMQRARSAPPFS
jgi:hypothetical protein